MRSPQHVARYSNLRVQFIDHHNPDLVLLDKLGAEIHRIDLTRLSTTRSMHKLMVLLGLQEVGHHAPGPAANPRPSRALLACGFPPKQYQGSSIKEAGLSSRECSSTTAGVPRRQPGLSFVVPGG